MDWVEYRDTCAATLRAVDQAALDADTACRRIHGISHEGRDAGIARFLCGVLHERESNPETFEQSIDKLESGVTEAEFSDWYVAQPEPVLPEWLRDLFTR